MKTTDSMVLFWGSSEIYSNFHYSPFVVNGVRYRCVEQFMMACKAMLFGDMVALGLIMKETVPFKMQQIGRTVKGYTDEKWFAVRDDVVFQGCLAKFQQNQVMGRTLLATDDLMMVEASPKDRIWGIGLGENDPRALIPTKWLGDNRLGKALMRVRDVLRGLFAAPAPSFPLPAPPAAPAQAALAL